MSKSTNHTEKSQVAGYGLHYHANNLLISNTSDRVLFQYIIDVVRNQLSKSPSNQPSSSRQHNWLVLPASTHIAQSQSAWNGWKN